MVASDLDGTLLRTDGTLSPRTVAAVAAAEQTGIVVVLLTARPPRWIDGLLDQLACHGIVACCNGALVYDCSNRTLVAEHPLPSEIALEVIRRLRAALLGFTVAVETGLTFGHEPTYPSQWPVPKHSLVATAEELANHPVAKLIVRHREGGDHWGVVERVRGMVGDLAEVTSSGVGAPIEISASGVDKAFALRALAGDLGVEAHQVLACGDMPNDLPMLRWAGHSVAPANAHPDVLAMVDRTTSACDDDGIAEIIEALLDGRL